MAPAKDGKKGTDGNGSDDDSDDDLLDLLSSGDDVSAFSDDYASALVLTVLWNIYTLNIL